MLVWARILITNFGVFVLLLALVEGASSLVLFLRSAGPELRRASVAWRHTLYDPELGWVSAPNVVAADLYGPGRHLRTNRRGFRHDRDVDEDTSAAGTRRVICSGDSFTFGYGVGNDQTWCARLGAIDPCLETVNLGQGGYGVDQAYLRYKRDAGDLRHDLHLLAFVTDDFTRMQSDTFHGYGKPLLKLEDGTLTIGNVPAPRRPFYVAWATAIIDDLRELRTFEIVDRVRRRLRLSPIRQGEASLETMPEEAGELLKKIFEETARLADERASQLVLVYLPSPGEHSREDGTWRAWSEFLQRAAGALGIPLIDIVAQHDDLSPSEAAALFGEHRHLSVRGNEYVAWAIQRGLRAFPQTAELTSHSERGCLVTMDARPSRHHSGFAHDHFRRPGAAGRATLLTLPEWGLARIASRAAWPGWGRAVFGAPLERGPTVEVLR